jgi:hypothetical protein
VGGLSGRFHYNTQQHKLTLTGCLHSELTGELQEPRGEDDVEVVPVDVIGHNPVVVVVALVRVAQGDEGVTEVVRHPHDEQEVQLREVFEALDAEQPGEAGGLGGGDAVRNHREPERSHCAGDATDRRRKYVCTRYLCALTPEAGEWSTSGGGHI